MALKNDLTQLNNLHDLLVDSRKGYLEAAERVEDDRVKGLLASISSERATLEVEVDALIRQADPEAGHREGGTIKGDLHRAWMDLRDSLSKSDNANVLAECERGEDFLMMRYNEVLQATDLDPATRALAVKQRAVVNSNVAKIKELRKRFEKVEG